MIKLRNISVTRWMFLGGSIASLLGIFFFLSQTQANSAISFKFPIGNGDMILYSANNGGGPGIESFLPSTKVSQSVPASSDDNAVGKELFLSPDRKLIAVTVVPPGDDVWPSTYLTSIDGARITDTRPGTFISWAPDSSKALLYYSPTEAPWVRKIYALDTSNKYYDFGLSDGTINADISPLDGSILYSFTSGGTDNSTLFVRDPQGKDTPILKGNNNIFAWVRWSPKGDKIGFLKSDLLVSRGEVWTMDPDGTGQAKVSDVDWNYPPVWSPDGTKVAFSNKGDIWEFNVAKQSLANVTSMKQGEAEHPSYSADGQLIVFDANGQIWKTENGTATQLTRDGQQKNYPILP